MAVSVERREGRGRRRPDQLSGGRHGLTREQVAESQRRRIVAAMTAAVGDRGYHGVRVADVVDLAGVSRKTFYQLFDDKRDCFAATYEVCADRLLTTTLEAFDGEREWPDRLRAAIGALLAALARDPSAARLCFTEVNAVDGPTDELRERFQQRLAALFEAPEAPDGTLGATLRSGRVAELSETLRREVAAGRAGRLPELGPELVCAMVLPFLGIDAARRELERGAPRAR